MRKHSVIVPTHRVTVPTRRVSLTRPAGVQPSHAESANASTSTNVQVQTQTQTYKYKCKRTYLLTAHIVVCAGRRAYYTYAYQARSRSTFSNYTGYRRSYPATCRWGLLLWL